MSIIDLEQTGEWLKCNQADIAIVVGFILVAIIAFGTGRLSAPEIVRNPIIIDEPNAASSVNILSSVSRPLIGAAGESAGAAGQTASSKGIFVASKGGTKYYWPWCSWAARIKPENQRWFNSEKDAQGAGYSPSVCIPQQAPAGYVKP